MSHNRGYVPDFASQAHIGLTGIIISVLLHGGMVGAAIVMGSFSFGVPAEQPDMVISIADARIPLRNLPPLGDSQEAGPVTSPGSADPGPQNQAAVAEVEQIKEPEIDSPPEETVKEEEKQVERPREEEKPVETPVEKKVEQPKPKVTQPKPVETSKPEQKPAEREVVSTNPQPRQTEESTREVEEPAGPTPKEIADELASQRGSRSRTFSSAGGGTATGLIAAGEGGDGRISSGPALYNSNLTQLISINWQPPAYRPGEVRDCTVEFTIYSPPLERNAVNQVRVARIMNIRIAKSSGDDLYDQRAMEAVRRVRSWPPPPDSYRKETLVVTCRFYLVGDEQ